MARLRDTIHLRSYANVNPLQDYVNEGYSMFRECLELASVEAVLNLVNVKITPRQPEIVKEEEPEEGIKKENKETSENKENKEENK